MGLQQRDGNVPGAVGLSKEADELRWDLRLGLAQGDALQQCLQAQKKLRASPGGSQTCALVFQGLLVQLKAAYGQRHGTA